MPKSADPFYSRKPVPDELIQGTGIAGLSEDQAFESRERKLSKGGKDGSDLRKFSNFYSPKNDPYYQRKPVPDHLIEGTGVPGLTQEQAYENHERKLSTVGKDGGDLRKFSNWFSPPNDPHYARKPVPDHLVKDEVTDIDPVEKYENRERKLSMFTLTNDPFDQISGRRSSVVGDSALGVGRRRSSAVAPDHMATATQAHSGYDGEQLAPIESRAEPSENPSSSTASVTRRMGLGEPLEGLVHDVVTGGADNSEHMTMARSEAGQRIAV